MAEPAGVLLLVGPDGSLIDASSAALERYGYSRLEIKALSIRDITADHHQDAILDRMRQAADHAFGFETVHRRRDGTEFAVEVEPTHVSLGSETALLSAVREVDGRDGVQAAQCDMGATLTAPLETPAFALDRELRFAAFGRAFAAAYEATYGTPPHIGHSFFEGIEDEDERVQVREDFESVLVGRASHAEGWRTPRRARRLWTVTRSPIWTYGRVDRAVLFGVDTTARALEEFETVRQALLLDQVVAVIRDAIILVDCRGVVVQANQEAEHLTGCSSEEIVGGEVRLLAHSVGRASFEQTLAQALVGEVVDLPCIEIRGTDDTTIEVSLRVAPLKGWAGEMVGACVALRPLEVTAFYDALTKVCNRRGFHQSAGQAIAQAQRTGASVGLLYADVDGLKAVNDSFGHELGDVALQDVAAILQTAMREADVIARLGGDEFVVLTVGVDEDGMQILTARFQEAVERLNASAERPFKLSVSCGTSVRDHADAESLGSMLRDADERMYEAKRRGGAGTR